MGRWQLLLALVTGGVLTIAIQGWYGVSAAGADPILDAADPNPAMSTPYKYAWQLFTELNKPAGNQSQDTVWEAWASDAETFPAEPDPNKPPQWPGSKHRPKTLRPPAQLARANLPPGVGFPKVDLPGDREEVTRNKPTFDYIMANKLWYVEGLTAAYQAGKTVSFPIDSIEIKAHWKPIGEKEKARFHWNVAKDGKLIGLTALHITTKGIPNWFWATFEQIDNPEFGKILGFPDTFGVIPPNRRDSKASDALKAMFKKAGLGNEWLNYRLGGTQTDYIDSTGRPLRMGNTIIEPGLVQYSSCITCHGMARVGPKQVEGFQFDIGAPDPKMFYGKDGKPKNMTLDFVWGFMFAQPAKKAK
jgi:hypothetical protein